MRARYFSRERSTIALIEAIADHADNCLVNRRTEVALGGYR